MINIFENSIYDSLPLRWKSSLQCPWDYHVPKIPWGHKILISLICTCWVKFIENQRYSPWENIVLNFSPEILTYRVQVKHPFCVWDQQFGSFYKGWRNLLMQSEIQCHKCPFFSFGFLIPYEITEGASDLCVYP